MADLGTSDQQPGSRRSNRRERSRDAKNPEGASAEAFTLSGLSLVPQLQDPEGSGLPVRARYRLSVVPTLPVSCLTSSTEECRPVPLAGQVESLKHFRDPNLDFANHQPAVVKPGSLAPPSAVLPRPVRSARRRNTWKLGIGRWKRRAERKPEARETPRERRPELSPSRGSQTEPSLRRLQYPQPKGRGLRSGPKPVPKVGSSPNRSPVPKPHSHRTEARSKRPPLSKRKPPVAGETLT